MKKFPVWKTIKLGTPGMRTLSDSQGALEGKVRINDDAMNMIGRVEFTRSISASEVEVDLVVLTTFELTSKLGGAEISHVLEGARRLGLAYSAEVGPQLRWQYTDQPYMEELLVGMDPIRESLCLRLMVFRIIHEENGTGQWLKARRCDRGDKRLFAFDDKWVFIQPRTA